MRSDYALYAAAIILFVITGIFLAYQIESTGLVVITTAVFGFLFIGLGYSQRPRLKPKVTAIEVTPPAPPLAPATPPEAPVVTEVVKEEPAPVVEAAPPKIELTEVKGIGEKRAGQLRSLGISSVEDLANASSKDLASQLKVSPKITQKWIEHAKELVGKS